MTLNRKIIIRLLSNANRRQLYEMQGILEAGFSDYIDTFYNPVTGTPFIVIKTITNRS